MDNLELKKAELADSAKQYVELKSQIDPLEKKCKSLNTTIKGLMELLDVTEIQLSNGASVKYSVSTKETLNEDKLLIKLKQFAPNTQCIKTREYIDMDILENEIYHGKLSDDAMIAMDECRETKEIPKLTVERKKNKE